ncbi:MAG: HAMP domain-containing histidine kinase [Gammaproteobacteria bacterium]|nr:HAMP domain-containing histidine kinase [Gammaproteobacteria bacterium]MDH5630910.1 HAMP domain-containing histidine kinase [Gammaproteobacteria bacterium]
MSQQGNQAVSQSQGESNPHLNSVMSELNRLSRSVVDSYQSLEGQVEKLNDQLKSEKALKNQAIAKQKSLSNEKASLLDRLQNLLTIMPAGFVVIGGDARVHDCNAKAVELLGRPLLGELWLDVIQRAFEPQADDGHQISLKDGRKIHIETRALDLEPGQLVVLTDMTKTRQLQMELSQQQKLSSMGKMVASLAHQIRTPLSAAILYGSQLNHQHIASDTRQQFGDKLLERLHFMERQINDMLCFVRGERKVKESMTAEVLYQTLEKQKQDFPKFVNFTYKQTRQLDQNLMVDIDALRGALNNLIENACDACKDKNQPAVTVSFVCADKLIISVMDNGIGIDQQKQKNVFEPFFTTKSSGNGLGLAIVNGVAINHGGSVKLSSSENRGTCVEITLPLADNTDKNTVNQINESMEPKKMESINEF